MKKINNLLLGSLLFFASCEPMVTFNHPLPQEGKALENFPKQLLGTYISNDSDQSVLTISASQITETFELKDTISKDSLTTNYILIDNNKVVDTLNNDTFLVHVVKDSIYVDFSYTDTLFTVSKPNILKKFKGHYFLNIPYEDTAWNVHQLSLQKGKLSINAVSDSTSFNKLMEITESPNDTVATPVTINNKELKQFIKQNGFAPVKTYTRIK